MPTDAHLTAEAVARESYGRLVAYLSARSRDVAGAEDALGDAFRLALETWPEYGVPARPEAWLLTVARRQMIDRARHGASESRGSRRAQAGCRRGQAESAFGHPDDDRGIIPDDRLKLMFVCAHPAIDAGRGRR